MTSNSDEASGNAPAKTEQQVPASAPAIPAQQPPPAYVRPEPTEMPGELEIRQDSWDTPR